MASAPNKRAPWLLLCVLALVSAFSAPQGLVLCVGENGHVAIETAVEVTPCGVPLRASDAFGAPPVELCRDTALIQTALRASVAPEVSAPLALVAPLPAREPPAAAAALPRFREPLFLSSTLRSQRIIVLLV